MLRNTQNIYPPPLPSPESVLLAIENTALVIIDMQNDFCRPDGKSYIGPMVGPTIPRIRSLLDMARASGMRVIHTQSWHYPDDPRYWTQRHPRASIGVPCCKADTSGAEIVRELRPTKEEPAIKKDTYDPFFGTEMERVLERMNFAGFEHDSAQKNRLRHEFNIVLTGTASDVCVDKAAFGFFARGYKLIIPVDCISTKNEFGQESALYRFHSFFDAVLTTSKLIEFKALVPR